MDKMLIQSLRTNFQRGSLVPGDLPTFFNYLAWLGAHDEELQEEVEGWHGSIQFRLEGLGEYWLEVQDGHFRTGEGAINGASVQLRLSASDAVRIFTGALTSEDAFAAGALAIDGDLTAALRLQTWVEIAIERLLDDSFLEG